MVKKVYVVALNAFNVVNSLSMALFPSHVYAQGGIVKQGNPPWLMDATTTSNLYGALTAPIPTQSSTTSIGGVGILQGGNALSSTNPAFFRQTDGTNLQTIDPCQSTAKVSAPISISIATTTRIVTEAASKKVYICSFDIITNAANGVALMEGTGATCTGGTPAGIAGGTTGATGWQFAANGGMTKGAGLGSVFQSGTTAYSVCIVTSATTQLSGSINYVQF